MLALVVVPGAGEASAASPAAQWRASVQSAPGRTVLPMRAPQLGASAVAVRPDGGVVVFGVVSGRLATAALLPDGRLDPSYGEGGIALTALAIEPRRLMRLPGGRLLVAGVRPVAVLTTGPSWLLVRLRSDGTPDASFGAGGVVDAGGPAANIWGMAPQLASDGAVVLPTIAGSLPPSMAGLLRVRPDGTRDPAFGGDGLARIPAGVYVQSFAAAPDGSLVAIVTDAPLSRTPRMFVVRITAAGELDPAYGGGAPVQIAALVTNLVVDPGGAVTLLTYDASTLHSALVRLAPDGRLDASWGVGGTTDLGARRFSAILPADDGALQLVVYGLIGAATPAGAQQQVVRVSRTGQIDAAFGGPAGRLVTLPFGGGSYRPGAIADLRQNAFSASAVTRRPDGTLLFDGVVSASQERYTNAGSDVLAAASGIAVAALNRAFALDGTFRGTSPLRLGLTITSRRLTSRGLALALRSSGPALSVVTARAGDRIIARATVPFLMSTRSKSGALPTHRHVRLKLTSAGRRLGGRRGRVTVFVTLRAADLAGNRVTRRASARLAR